MIKLYLVLSALLLVTLVYAQEKGSGKELTEGMKAPDFTLQDSNGKEFRLSSFKDKSPVIVYFYPKANTAGCTKQACGIRDDWSKFEKNNIRVFGISTDSKKDIKEFIKNNSLNFPLLSDESKKVSKEYGVLSDNGYDKRITFIIDKKGVISKVLPVTDIDNHSKEVFTLASKLK
jgi:peroxiredoxin Q/BCP